MLCGNKLERATAPMRQGHGPTVHGSQRVLLAVPARFRETSTQTKAAPVGLFVFY